MAESENTERRIDDIDDDGDAKRRKLNGAAAAQRGILKRSSQQKQTTSDDELNAADGDGSRSGKSTLKFETPEDEEIHRLTQLLGMKNEFDWKNDDEFGLEGFTDLLATIDNAFAATTGEVERDDSKNYDDDDDEAPEHIELSLPKGRQSYDDADGAVDDADDEVEEDILNYMKKSRNKDNVVDDDDKVDEDYDNNADDDDIVVDYDNTANDVAAASPSSMTTTTTTTTKYVPPQRRAEASGGGGGDDDNADSMRTQRLVKRLLNTLSPGNVAAVSGELETLFARCGRRATIDAVVSEIEQLCETTTLSVTLALAFASLGVLVGATRGVECIALLLERSAHRLEQALASNVRRTAQNHALLWACLYRLRALSARTIASLLASLVARFDALAVELALLLLQRCGVYLRREDPAAFKAIVLAVQQGAVGRTIDSRAQYMIDAIVDLKDNRKRRDDALGELATREHKQIGALIAERAAVVNAPLRATYDDLLQADAKGRWWLVGSAWLGNLAAPPTSSATTMSNRPADVADADDGDDQRAAVVAPSTIIDDEQMARTLAGTRFDDKLHQLARSHGMNTDVRRAIFW